MHLVLLHGYLLEGTGSNFYVANIARAMVSAWFDRSARLEHCPLCRNLSGPMTNVLMSRRNPVRYVFSFLR
jgi:hypothetical protein